MRNQTKALAAIAFTIGAVLGLMMTVDHFRGIPMDVCAIFLVILLLGAAAALYFTPAKKSDVEIERKFLVHESFRQHISKTHIIRQGYLSDDPARTVRVRTMDNKAFLTIKGAGNESGTSRFEFEIRIPMRVALKLLEICLPGDVVKQRHIVKVGKHTFEIDEFAGDNSGLIIAEIELTSENEAFNKPDWIRAEVTGDKRFYNSALRTRPFNSWSAEEVESCTG